MLHVMLMPVVFGVLNVRPGQQLQPFTYPKAFCRRQVGRLDSVKLTARAMDVANSKSANAYMNERAGLINEYVHSKDPRESKI